MAVERAAGVPHGRLAEGGDAVADRLDAGHRRAAAGEGSHQDPERRRHRRPRAAAPAARPASGCPCASSDLTTPMARTPAARR